MLLISKRLNRARCLKIRMGLHLVHIQFLSRFQDRYLEKEQRRVPDQISTAQVQNNRVCEADTVLPGP